MDHQPQRLPGQRGSTGLSHVTSSPRTTRQPGGKALDSGGLDTSNVFLEDVPQDNNNNNNNNNNSLAADNNNYTVSSAVEQSDGGTTHLTQGGLVEDWWRTGGGLVETFREQISSEAEHLVASFFPKKLLELDQFLKEPILNVSDLKDIHSEIQFKVPEPILFTNSHEGGDVNTKKRKLEDGLTDDSWQGGTKAPVKMWVQLLIPRIEDGNNFGVSIQEETVAELRTVESEAASYLDQISRYYITRAKLVSKIVKYPHVEDYRRTITEIDEKEYISLKIIVSELRNQYVILHDMILKNIEKIKKPRNSNAEALY
ncbi:Proteasome activator complex subunit 3 [Liparis tanakae]|uniref:Proteasome activator complex subunit 3 n=1 Tax=Liparis tanakae TaxID=230148 RepID=A0A4Z2EZ01_9TELE|nr:Proteasome activator complex subunit 3 [Liparis tanakae]